ncbi:hypothetical protein [uncultured Clostridium sp.]|jgi:hypothetical protein|uniref:hypothetical protein n=1 Tax=uncultured Clostridium sp. TaxID=59620 RepID=UPI0025F0D07E|nr:hypothetical protein [uncultured Clostridium sp.]
MESKKEYALYKGENLLSIGTIEEIAEEVGSKVENVKYYATNAYKRKIAKRKNGINHRVLVELESEDE